MSLGADVISMMRRAGVVVSIGGVDGVGLFDVAGRVSIRTESGALIGRLIQVRTATAQFPAITAGDVVTVDATEYVVHRVLQEHEGAVTLSLVAEKDGSAPTLRGEFIAESQGVEQWRFYSNSPSDVIEPTTVTAPAPGAGSVQIVAHSGSPQFRGIEFIGPASGQSFDVFHTEQADDDLEWVLDGIETTGGVLFAPLSIRFIPKVAQ